MFRTSNFPSKRGVYCRPLKPTPRGTKPPRHSHAMQTCRGVLKVRQRQVIRLRQSDGGRLTCLANLAWLENLERNVIVAATDWGG